MKEISNISELKELLESNKISKVYIQIIETVRGYYQLKEGFISDKEPLQGIVWNEIEGSPTDVGKYNTDKPIYLGYFNIKNQHEVNLDWFIDKFNGFVESDSLEVYKEVYPSFHYQFIYYGQEEGDFDVNSEMGLHGEGLNYSELRKSMKITLSTKGKEDDIETGLVSESIDEDVIWTFDLI